MGFRRCNIVLKFQPAFYYFQEGAKNNNKHLPALVSWQIEHVQRSFHLSFESQLDASKARMWTLWYTFAYEGSSVVNLNIQCSYSPDWLWKWTTTATAAPTSHAHICFFFFLRKNILCFSVCGCLVLCGDFTAYFPTCLVPLPFSCPSRSSWQHSFS